MKTLMNAARIRWGAERMLRHLWGEHEIPASMFTNGYFEPAIDVFETSEAIVVKMEIAGMRKKDVVIELHNDTLIIKGRRDDKSPGKKNAYFQMEINYGTFERRIKIEVEICTDKITAFYRDGFLEVRLPLRKLS
jgi:HSP20 family protein